MCVYGFKAEAKENSMVGDVLWQDPLMEEWEVPSPYPPSPSWSGLLTQSTFEHMRPRLPEPFPLTPENARLFHLPFLSLAQSI